MPRQGFHYGPCRDGGGTVVALIAVVLVMFIAGKAAHTVGHVISELVTVAVWCGGILLTLGAIAMVAWIAACRYYANKNGAVSPDVAMPVQAVSATAREAIAPASQSINFLFGADVPDETIDRIIQAAKNRGIS